MLPCNSKQWDIFASALQGCHGSLSIIPEQFDGCGKAVLEMDRWQLWNQRLAAVEGFGGGLALCSYAIVCSCSFSGCSPDHCFIPEPRTNRAGYLGRDCRAEPPEQTVDQKQKPGISHWANKRPAVTLTSPHLHQQQGNFSSTPWEFELHSSDCSGITRVTIDTWLQFKNANWNMPH